MRGNKYSAKKTLCANGHNHASKREAKRCDELHLLQRAGEITHLEIEPKFTFIVNGAPMKMLNGQNASYRPDFTYFTADAQIAEDVKGMVTEAFRLRSALFRACYPGVELRIIK